MTRRQASVVLSMLLGEMGMGMGMSGTMPNMGGTGMSGMNPRMDRLKETVEAAHFTVDKALQMCQNAIESVTNVAQKAYCNANNKS